MKTIAGMFVGTGFALAMWSALGGGGTTPPHELRILLASVLGAIGLWFLGTLGTPSPGRPTGARSPWFRRWRILPALLLASMALFWSLMAMRTPARLLASAGPGFRFSSGQTTHTTAAMDGTEPSGSWLHDEGARRALPRKTNLKPGQKPEVFLRFDDSEDRKRFEGKPIHVLAMTFDHYTDSAWEISPSPPLSLQADASGRIVLPTPDSGSGIGHTVVLSADPKHRTPLVGLPGVAYVEGVAHLDRWAPGLHLLPQPRDHHSGYRYRVRSCPRLLGDIPDHSLSALPEMSVAPAPKECLGLPDGTLRSRIVELARSITGGRPAAQALRDIQAYLRNKHRYSLSTANLRNLDPVENFLFEEKSGHCEYFATAGALMARACGIPARVCYGWAGGTWYEQADWFVFRADEAHAWVEAWLDGHGWTVMDPTPPEALGVRRQRVSRDPAPPLPDDADAGSPQDGPESTRVSPAWPWIGITLGCTIAGTLALLLLACRRPSHRLTTETEAWRDTASGHYWKTWTAAFQKRLARRPQPASTLRQQLAGFDPQPEFSGDLLRYHYRVSYHDEPRDPREERDLVRRIHTWAAGLRE